MKRGTGAIIKWMWVVCCLLLLGGCNNALMPPTDEEMSRLFLEHEDAFNRLKEIVLKRAYGWYYPPYDSIMVHEDDSLSLEGLSVEDKSALDSILKAISCKRISIGERTAVIYIVSAYPILHRAIQSVGLQKISCLPLD